MLANGAAKIWTNQSFSTLSEQLERVVDYLVRDSEQAGRKGLVALTYYVYRLIMPLDIGQEIKRRNFPCGAGYNYCMIDSEGSIWPCHRFDGAARQSGIETAMKLGNIYSLPYNNRLSNAFRNIDHTMMLKESCNSCPLEPICGGGCPGGNLEHTRRSIYQGHDADCQFRRVLYSHACDFYGRLRELDPKRAVEYFVRLGEGRFGN